MKQKMFVLMILMACVVGCTSHALTPSTQETPTQLRTIEPNVNLITSPSTTVQSTPTPISTFFDKTTTPTHLLTPKNPATQVDEDIPSCKNSGMPTDPPDGFGIDGVIVYRKQGQGGIRLIGGRPLTYASLPVSGQSDYKLLGFSPDGKWFAFSKINYLSGEQRLNPLNIELISADGQRLKQSVDLNELTKRIQPWDYAARWLDFPPGWTNDHLINLMIQYASSERGVYLFTTLHAPLNPFDGKWHFEIIDELPNYDGLWGGPGISDDLTRVLYSSKPDPNGVRWTVLWDMSSHQELFRYRWGFSESRMARWSPDNAWVIYQENEEQRIFIVSRNGNLLQEIAAARPALNEGEVRLFDYYWSPSSRYIAFSGEKPKLNSGGKEQSLYIYDLSQNRYVFRCAVSTGGFYGVYWSPDSRQVVLTYLYEPDYPLILIDIQSGDVFKLAGNSLIGGWSNQFSIKK
jgi:dipeptidyl aminopeptidase/acylaminoacyl peptidase